MKRGVSPQAKSPHRHEAKSHDCQKPTALFKFHHRQQGETRDFLFFFSFQRLTEIIRFSLLPNVDVGREYAHASPLCIVEGLTQNRISCLAHGNRLQSLYQLGVEPELIAAQGAKTADMIFKPQPGAAIRGRSN